MTNATTNNVIARVAAAVAGLGLVASAFAPMAMAQTTTTTTTTTSTTATFSRDLTIGSTGADVTALQNWLIAKGHTIAAGATGYFGAQTKAALAAYQASAGITPAAGYFGPITRAKVAAEGGSTTGGSTTGGSTNNGSLSGGEADLSDYNLRREESTGDEGEEEVEVFTVEFDVEDGDIMVERMEIVASSSSTTLNTRPWDYFDRVIVMVDGDEVADMDVDSRDDWDEEEDDIYVLDITGLDIMVDEDDTAEITVAFDIAGSIDSDDLDQEFEFFIEDEGIRAVDAEGIQQYIGKGKVGENASESVTFGFGEEESGDLRIRTSSEDPDATTLIADEDDESEEYTVFVFDIENRDDVDVELLDMTVDVNVSSTTIALDDVIRRATLVVDGEEVDGDISTTVGADTIAFEDIEVEVGGDDEITVELMITLVRNAANTQLTFSVDDVDAEGVDSGEEATVNGSATSKDHTVALDGIVATAEEASNRAGNEADSTVNDGVGTFRITFEVEAIEEDAYIARTTANAASTTAGFTYNVFSGTTATTTGATAAISSSADIESGYYVVREGDSETFTLTVTLDSGTVSGSFYVELDEVRFADTASQTGLQDYIIPDDSQFESEVLSLY